MKKKAKLLTVLLTILFSFAITSAVCAECTVELSPSNPTVSQGGTIQFAAVTQGEGCNEPNYTWEITTPCTTGSSIDQNGVYTATDQCDRNCFIDVIKVTDTANGNISAETITTIAGCCNFEVMITPVAVTLEPGESQTFCAETMYCSKVEGTYSWNIEGGTANTTSGVCITYTADEECGTYTITVTDTTHGDAQASATVILSMRGTLWEGIGLYPFSEMGQSVVVLGFYNGKVFIESPSGMVELSSSVYIDSMIFSFFGARISQGDIAPCIWACYPTIFFGIIQPAIKSGIAVARIHFLFNIALTKIVSLHEINDNWMPDPGWEIN